MKPLVMERETGLEPATTCLEGRGSTTELLPQNQSYFTPKYLEMSKDFKRGALSKVIAS
jgi:hypothetical protein